MKYKRFFPILALLSAFVVSGCGATQPSSSAEPSRDSSPSTSEPSTSSSEDKTSSPSSSSSSSVSTSSNGSTSSSSSSSSSSAQQSSSSSSSSSSSAPVKEYFKTDIAVQLDPGIKEAPEGETLTPYNLSFKFDDEYFLSDPKEYNKDLSMLSLGASIATGDETGGNAFLNAAEFKDISAHDYDVTPTKDTMGYFMAHKTIDEYELVTVSFRGFNYAMEWANNFQIGKTGDHEGFAARGAEAYAAFKTYVSSYASGKSLKVWINGYSRAGALSNVLASLILRNNELPITQDNMFVYTFEAPASLDEPNALPYANVHNINNQADLITFIPPAEYSLYRCGVDYQIYDPNVSTIMKAFDPDTTIPEFQETDDLGTTVASDFELRDLLLNSIFNKEIEEGESTEAYANTREQYVDNYQTGLSNAIGYVFAMKASTRAAMLEDLQADIFTALTVISDETGAALADFMKTYLDRDGIVYDAESLQADCAILIKGVQNLFLTLLSSFVGDGAAKNDLTRLLDMHYPETTYVLLKYTHEKPIDVIK